MRVLAKITLSLLLLLMLGATGLYWWSAPPRSASELLFSGGSIQPIVGSPAEALWVKDGRIMALGDAAELRREVGPEVQHIDLGGGALLPGFIEPHTHPLATAMLSAVVDVSGFRYRNRAEVMQALEEAAAGPQLGPWLIAFGWDPVMLEDLEPPTLAELDTLAPDRPLVILTQMMHDAYANSAALQAAGIGADTANPPGAEFVRDAQGRLTGTVREVAAINQLMDAVPPPPAGIVPILLELQLGRYAAAGYTTLGVLGPVGRVADPIAMLRQAIEQEQAPLRAAVWALPHQLDAEQQPDRDPHFALRGVKFWMDGSPFAGGAAWAEPYENSPLVRERLHLPADHLAELNYARDEYYQQFRDFHRRGFAVATHVQGERAVERALDVAAAVLREMPRSGHRHRLEHNALISEAQMARAHELGIELSFFVDHVRFYGDRLVELVGPERTQRYMPLAGAARLGHRLTLHGDHPATPINPLRSLATAVQRQAQSGTQIAPEQALSMREALRAMTINAAWQLGLEREVGSLEAGKAADLVWLSADPLQTPPEQLENIAVRGTWLDGRPVDHRWLNRRLLQRAWQALVGD